MKKNEREGERRRETHTRTDTHTHTPFFLKIEKCLLRSNLSKRSKKHTHTHTACDHDVTPYADTATRGNKSEVATSLLAPRWPCW